MIELQDIHLSFADRVVFDGVNWTIPDKAGSVWWDNGTGKTTLFRTILGEVEPDREKAVIGARKERLSDTCPRMWRNWSRCR